MKLSAADLADVKPLDDAPAAGKSIRLSQADLADVKDAEPPLTPAELADLRNAREAPSPRGIGLSGPGSKDDQFPAHPPIEAPVPRGPSDIPADLASGALHSVKSIGRGLQTLSGEASPLGPEGARVPFSGLMEGSKRRELERGVSDVATFGLAEKAAGKLFPDYAASAAPDAAAAPGYRDAGGVAGMALPNPVGEAVAVAGKAGEAAIGRAGEAVKGVGEGSIARSDKRLAAEAMKGGTEKQRAKLDQVEQEAVDYIRRKPALKSALGNGEKFSAALEDELGPIEANQKQTLARAQMVAGKAPADVIEAELRAAQAKVGDKYATEEVSKALDEHITKAMNRAKEGKAIDLEDLRAEKSRLQKIAFDKGPNAKTTEAQAAAGIAAGVIKDALEAHIEKALPGEGKAFAQRATDESVLLRLKAIADKNAANPRKSTGYFATMARRVTNSPLGATLTAVPTAVKYGFRSADEALAALARAARGTKEPLSADMVAEAFAAGVKPSSVDAIVSRAPMTDAERMALQDEAQRQFRIILRERAGLATPPEIPAQTPSQIAREAVPTAVEDAPTAAIPTESMADIVPVGAGGEDLAAGQAARAALPDDTELLNKTQRIRAAR